MDLLSKITQIVEPTLTSMGYCVVQMKLNDGKTRTLSVMAERIDGQMMSFDDCTEISRTISALLDVEDPIEGAYNLEVMSPGIDRPLTRIVDYTRFSGFVAKIETLLPVDGRKRFKGVLKGIANDVIALSMPEGNVQIPFRQVRSAKLVVTDELIEAEFSKQNPENTAKPKTKFGAQPKKKAKA